VRARPALQQGQPGAGLPRQSLLEPVLVARLEPAQVREESMAERPVQGPVRPGEPAV
jgi:hypothetical protein